MTNFITTNAVALVAALGFLLAGCAILLSVTMFRRARQRHAVRRLVTLVRELGRCNSEAVTSTFVHDLNNMLLVLSMESERLEGSGQADILQQVIAEGRDVVERCRAGTAAVETSSSDLCPELRAATALLNDAGYCTVDIAVARAVPAAATVPRPASDVHMLVLSVVCAARTGDNPDRVSLTVSRGRDAALPEDANDSDWVNVSTVGPDALSDADPAGGALTRVARRLSGEVVFPDPASGRRRLAVSLPVIAR